MRLSMGLSKLPMFKLPALKALAMIALVVSMSACSMFRSKATIDNMPLEALYNNAHASLENADGDSECCSHRRARRSASRGPTLARTATG